MFGSIRVIDVPENRRCFHDVHQQRGIINQRQNQAHGQIRSTDLLHDQPAWITVMSLSKMTWNGNALQKVAGEILFSSASPDFSLPSFLFAQLALLIILNCVC